MIGRSRKNKRDTNITKTPYVITSNRYIVNNKIATAMEAREYDVLYTYNKIDLCAFNNMNFIKHLDENHIKHILNYAINRERVFPSGDRLSHYICQHYYSNENLIKHMIELRMDFNCIGNEGFAPIHLILVHQRNNDKIIKYIIDRCFNPKYKNIGMKCKDIFGKTPSHYICCYTTPEIIKYMLTYIIATTRNITQNNKYIEVYLECKDNENLTPMHYICLYSSYENVQILVNHNDKILNNEYGADVKPYDLLCKEYKEELDWYLKLTDDNTPASWCCLQ